MKPTSIHPLIVLMLLTAPIVAGAQEPRTLRELQRQFLTCEREAAQRLMSAVDAAACSRAYEELLQRGFDGDFMRLLAWWQSERAAALAVAAPPP